MSQNMDESWSHTGPSAPWAPGAEYGRHGEKSLSGIALRAFVLGAVLALGTVATVIILAGSSDPVNPLWRVPFFLASLSLFHFLEFWTTAAHNTPEADVDSFLLTSNWPAYQIAHLASLAECLVTNIFWPQRAWAPFGSGPALLVMGLALTAVGQAVRSAAMIEAGRSFNHLVQHHRAQTHRLVTTGVYGRLRHPSYFGFFWWGVGLQLALGNVVCFVAYAVVIWRFFAARVPVEEAALVRFFGQGYVDYKRRVPTWIPFIP